MSSTSDSSFHSSDPEIEPKSRKITQKKLDPTSEATPVSDSDLNKAAGGFWTAGFERTIQGVTYPFDCVTDKIGHDGYGLDKEDMKDEG